VGRWGQAGLCVSELSSGHRPAGRVSTERREASSITGCIPLFTRADGWTLIHDPSARCVFACRSMMAERGVCRAWFHQSPATCTGPCYRYGRWWLWHRSPGRALDLCLAWLDRQRGTEGNPQEELERKVEILQLMESL